MLLNKPIDDISKDDILGLLDNSDHEIKTLEFKCELPGSSDRDKKEFLADVSSFANTNGGYLIYGINEEDGRAESLNPFDKSIVDETILRLENILRDGLDPRIPNYWIRSIDIEKNKCVLVLQISQSLLKPHMVTYKGSSRFYGRNTNGKYQLDVDEIRQSFLRTNKSSDQIRDFRMNRISEIISGNTPVHLKGDKFLIIHLIPIQSYLTQVQIPFDLVKENRDHLKPMNRPITNDRFNLDGLLVYSSYRAPISYSYVQLFNNGVVETVDGDLLISKVNLIPTVLLESEIIRFISRIITLYRKIQIVPPIYIFLTLTNVRGMSMALNHSRHWNLGYQSQFNHPIDRDILQLPEFEISSFEIDSYSRTLKPMFDNLWRAAGWPYSHNYDPESGDWNVKQVEVP